MRYHLTTLVVAVATVWATSPGTHAQGQTMAEVLKNAAGYLAGFQKQLSGIAAEETYEQAVEMKLTGQPDPVTVQRRRLRSDLLLVKPDGADRYVEFRDVFEVDGVALREREDRLSALVRDASTESSDRMAAIIDQSARYNIGNIVRNVNTPVLALRFLDATFQSRFEFKRASKERERLDPVGATPPPADQAGPGVFRVSTEMWVVEYHERKRPTIVRTSRNRALPAQGRFWINPATGAVLISELVLKGGGVDATITVSYQSEPLLGFLVPVAMTESYRASGEHVVGTATYGRFRQLSARVP